jgi:hypothetical protein
VAPPLRLSLFANAPAFGDPVRSKPNPSPTWSTSAVIDSITFWITPRGLLLEERHRTSVSSRGVVEMPSERTIEGACPACGHSATVGFVNVEVEEMANPEVRQSWVACTNPPCPNYRAR